ncbi:hypothetical protein AAY473_020150 [Plecturocebus cupreus]
MTTTVSISYALRPSSQQAGAGGNSATVQIQQLQYACPHSESTGTRKVVLPSEPQPCCSDSIHPSSFSSSTFQGQALPFVRLREHLTFAPKSVCITAHGSSVTLLAGCSHHCCPDAQLSTLPQWPGKLYEKFSLHKDGKCIPEGSCLLLENEDKGRLLDAAGKSSKVSLQCLLTAIKRRPDLETVTLRGLRTPDSPLREPPRPVESRSVTQAGVRWCDLAQYNLCPWVQHLDFIENIVMLNGCNIGNEELDRRIEKM